MHFENRPGDEPRPFGPIPGSTCRQQANHRSRSAIDSGVDAMVTPTHVAGTTPPITMKLAYLVNQYPKTSHSFIRREIAAIEKLGLEVERFSIRPALERLENRVDEAEKSRTRVVLGQGVVGLLSSIEHVADRLQQSSRPRTPARP